jgi:tetratricopeptide (TPR) repeat protein
MMRVSSPDSLGFLADIIISLLVSPLLASPVPAVAQTANEYDRGLAAFRAGDYSTAADLFARVETALPGSTAALLYRSKCLIHVQDFAGAERQLRVYLNSHRASDEAGYLLGYVLHREAKPRESLEAYTRAAALKRPTADDLKIVGLDYVLLNDYPDAIHWLGKSVEMEPKNKDAWYCLGRAYYTQSRLAEARKAFLTVLDLDPRDVKAESNLGLIFESEAKPDEAIKAYREAITWQQANPHPNEQPLVNLGSLLTQQGRIEEAIPYLEKAAALAQNSGFCHLKLGVAYLRARQLGRARRELEQATQLEPDNAAAHYQLGRLYQAIHVPERAKVEFDRTKELQGRAVGAIPPSPKL